jgi:hypothetical protein
VRSLLRLSGTCHLNIRSPFIHDDRDADSISCPQRSWRAAHSAVKLSPIL